MTWVDRARAYWRHVRGYPEAREEGLTALELRVYKVRSGALLFIVGSDVALTIILDRPRALALIDTILGTLEEPEPPALAS